MGLCLHIIGGTRTLLVPIQRRKLYYNFSLPLFIIHRPLPHASTSKYNSGTRLLWQWRYSNVLKWMSNWVGAVWCEVLSLNMGLIWCCWSTQYLATIKMIAIEIAIDFLCPCAHVNYILIACLFSLFCHDSRLLSLIRENIQLLRADGALFRSTLFGGNLPVIV